MTGFIIRRAGQAVIVLLGVTLVLFLLLHALPGSLARAIIGPRATPQEIVAFNQANGLNHGVFHQYFTYLNHLLHGNLGFSYKKQVSVRTLLAGELPKDLLLVGSSLVIALLIAIPVGVAQAVRRNGLLDYAGTAVSFVLYALPPFAAAILAIALLAIKFHVFPAEAPQGSSVGAIVSDPRALILPVGTLALISFAQFSRYMRSSAIDSLAQDYIRTARAKGLSERLVLWRHVLRNSLVPIATLVGLSLPGVLTAGLVVEQVFNFPGVGLEYFNAATTDDYQVMLGVTVIVALVTVVGNLIADVGYAVLDPRVRYN
jgi:peptide/nickel transport system permease protein